MTATHQGNKRFGFRPFKNLIIAAMLVVATPVLARLAVPTFAAQPTTTPDISGTWKLNLAKSKMAKSMKIESETVVVTSSGSIVEFRFTTNGKPKTYTYSVDGVEHFLDQTVSTPIYSRMYYTTKWEGAALVTQYRTRIETSQVPMVGEAEGDRFMERWSLSPNRRVLTRTSTGSGDLLDQRFVYDKQ
jgi:hypothetical protein